MESKDNKYREIFSNNLNYYMQLNGKIQDDLVKALNLKSSTISSWCNAQKLPRMDKIVLLADYFGIHFSKLIEERTDNDYFEFICEDDSMFPLLDIGDIAVIYKRNTIEDTERKNKGTYLIKLNNTKTIRRIVLNEDNSHYQLLGMNTCCKTIYIPVNELYNQIQILGIVVKAENQSAFK